MGDGEIQEGMVWEAAMSAAHYKLDNITAFLDWNELQIDGKNENVMTVTPVDEKFKGFGWNVLKIDGHDMKAIVDALEEAKKCKGKPTIIIAKTIKGKGVSEMRRLRPPFRPPRPPRANQPPWPWPPRTWAWPSRSKPWPEPTQIGRASCRERV